MHPHCTPISTSWHHGLWLAQVRPYHFDFKCHVKKRWEGKTLVDLFAEEFPLLTRAYYSRAFEAGRLRVELSSVHGGRCAG